MAVNNHKLAHVCMLVEDIDKAVADYREILSVLDPKQLDNELVFYKDFGVGEERLSFATFPSTECEIQFMQPLTPKTPLYSRLDNNGEGVHHICFTSSNVREVTQELKDKNIRMKNDGELVMDPTMPWQEWGFIHQGPGHGVLIEVANAYLSINGTWQPTIGLPR
ncbi:VOC family protein [Rhodococcus sp. NPDC059968]|uniref:VOC family protein n=1 Tax=Rhodococcus sp. NPDC059968 TaxID=3347017 RepID=UPI00366C823E